MLTVLAVTEKTLVEDLSTEVAEAGRTSNSLDHEATGAEAAGAGAEAIGAGAEATGANVSAGREGIRGTYTTAVIAHIFLFILLPFFFFSIYSVGLSLKKSFSRVLNKTAPAGSSGRLHLKYQTKSVLFNNEGSEKRFIWKTSDLYMANFKPEH
jgi:hypothetical protein